MDFKVYICGRGTTGFNENHIVEDLFNNHMCIVSQSINEIRLRYTNVENVISQLLHLKKKGKQCGLSPKNTDINYEKVFISFLFFKIQPIDLLCYIPFGVTSKYYIKNDPVIGIAILYSK